MDKRNVLVKLIDSKKYVVAGLTASIVAGADTIFGTSIPDEYQMVICGVVLIVAMIMNGLEDAAEKLGKK